MHYGWGYRRKADLIRHAPADARLETARVFKHNTLIYQSKDYRYRILQYHDHVIGRMGPDEIRVYVPMWTQTTGYRINKDVLPPCWWATRQDGISVLMFLNYNKDGVGEQDYLGWCRVTEIADGARFTRTRYMIETPWAGVQYPWWKLTSAVTWAQTFGVDDD